MAQSSLPYLLGSSSRSPSWASIPRSSGTSQTTEPTAPKIPRAGTPSNDWRNVSVGTPAAPLQRQSWGNGNWMARSGKTKLNAFGAGFTVPNSYGQMLEATVRNNPGRTNMAEQAFGFTGPKPVGPYQDTNALQGLLEKESNKAQWKTKTFGDYQDESQAMQGEYNTLMDEGKAAVDQEYMDATAKKGTVESPSMLTRLKRLQEIRTRQGALEGTLSKMRRQGVYTPDFSSLEKLMRGYQPTTSNLPITETLASSS